MNGRLRLGERLFDACVAILLASLALYAAAWLLTQIWPWVLGVGVVAVVVWTLSWRQRGW